MPAEQWPFPHFSEVAQASMQQYLRKSSSPQTGIFYSYLWRLYGSDKSDCMWCDIGQPGMAIVASPRSVAALETCSKANPCCACASCITRVLSTPAQHVYLLNLSPQLALVST